jgi:alkylation response protein AidB-like acyl-CoA dehydrogenase
MISGQVLGGFCLTEADAGSDIAALRSKPWHRGARTLFGMARLASPLRQAGSFFPAVTACLGTRFLVRRPGRQEPEREQGACESSQGADGQ